MILLEGTWVFHGFLVCSPRLCGLWGVCVTWWAWLGCSYDFETKACHFMPWLASTSWCCMSGTGRSKNWKKRCGSGQQQIFILYHFMSNLRNSFWLSFEYEPEDSPEDCIPILTTLDTAIQSTKQDSRHRTYSDTPQTSPNCLPLFHIRWHIT